MKTHKRRKWIVLTLLVVLLLPALDIRLSVSEVVLPHALVKEEIRIALITDLHSNQYGTGQSGIMEKLDEARPDLVFLGGDIFDDYMPEEGAWTLLQALKRKYTTFYVTGNHEYSPDTLETLKERIRALGIHVMEGDTEVLPIKGTTVSVCGVDDAGIAGFNGWREQLERCQATQNETAVNLLISHRPEWFMRYREMGFEIVFSGHAHGGQWRIPFLLENGFYAPGQRFFPTYSNGLTTEGDTSIIVSRGLAVHLPIPRIWNRPEIVIIKLVPKSSDPS